MSTQGTTSDSSSRPSIGGTGYTQGGRVSVAPTRTPPRYDDIPRATLHKPAEALLAPVFNGVPNSEHVYFHSEDYPFAAEQFDRLEEERLNMKRNQFHSGGADIPALNALNFKQIKMGGADPAARSLLQWDEECVARHLGAIANSVATQEELDGFVLMKGEKPLNFMRLAGVVDAPGLQENVAQSCSMTFTSSDRLIFTQAKHSAEVGVPAMACCHAFIPCFHDQWSSRAWSSFYASIHTSEILQVFVQQTLSTKYHSTGCACHDICSELCVVGGYMRTDKDVEGVTQTLGDYDPEGFMKRFDKTRHMRHALVVRYVDCATNSVRQTVAMAHPNIPASELYKMVRSIEEKITLRAADWFKFKTLPTPLPTQAFQNFSTSTPLLKRRSYQLLMLALFIVALSTFTVNVTAGVFMIIAISIALGGSYYKLAKTAAEASSLAPASSSISLFITHGLGGFVFITAFFSALI